MSTGYPILPVEGPDALKLFNTLGAKCFVDDGTGMETICVKWCRSVDDKKILSTGPAYVRSHYKQWKQSNNVRAKMEPGQTQTQRGS